MRLGHALSINACAAVLLGLVWIDDDAADAPWTLEMSQAGCYMIATYTMQMVIFLTSSDFQPCAHTSRLTMRAATLSMLRMCARGTTINELASKQPSPGSHSCCKPKGSNQLHIITVLTTSVLLITNYKQHSLHDQTPVSPDNPSP